MCRKASWQIAKTRLRRSGTRSKSCYPEQFYVCHPEQREGSAVLMFAIPCSSYVGCPSSFYVCHPERSEGSAVSLRTENCRSLVAALLDCITTLARTQSRLEAAKSTKARRRSQRHGDYRL